MMQHYPILAIMTYFLGAFLIVIFGKNRTVRNAVGFLATAVPLCLLITLVKPVMMGGDIIAYWMGGRVPAGGYAIGIALEVDALSLFFGLLVATAVFAAMLYSFSYMSHDDNEPQYYTLFLMLCGGVMGLVLSGDLFNMFIMVEILTFAAVALTAFRNSVFGALEAAFKYLVVGSIGSSCILAGTIMLYAQAHTLNFAQLSAMIPGNLNLATTVAYALLFIGFCTKAFLVDQERSLRDHPSDLHPLPHHEPRDGPVLAGLPRLCQHVRLRDHGSGPARFQASAGLPLHLADRLCSDGGRPCDRPRRVGGSLPRDEPHPVQGPPVPLRRCRAA